MLQDKVVVFQPVFLEGGDKAITFSILLDVAEGLRILGAQTIFTQTLDAELTTNMISEVYKKADFIVSLGTKASRLPQVITNQPANMNLEKLDDLYTTYPTCFNINQGNKLDVTINYIESDFTRTDKIMVATASILKQSIEDFLVPLVNVTINKTEEVIITEEENQIAIEEKPPVVEKVQEPLRKRRRR